jgi:putative endonuclease
VPYTVYILRTSRDTLYTGIAKDLEHRLEEHRSKSVRSAKYMRGMDGFELVHTEKCESRGDALKREYEIKQLRRVEKEELIESGDK